MAEETLVIRNERGVVRRQMVQGQNLRTLRKDVRISVVGQSEAGHVHEAGTNPDLLIG